MRASNVFRNQLSRIPPNGSDPTGVPNSQSQQQQGGLLTGAMMFGSSGPSGTAMGAQAKGPVSGFGNAQGKTPTTSPVFVVQTVPRVSVKVNSFVFLV